MNKKDIQFLAERYRPEGKLGANMDVELPGELEDIPYDMAELNNVNEMAVIDSLSDLHSSVMSLLKLQKSMIERDKEDEYIDVLNKTIVREEVINITNDIEKAFRRLTGER